MNPYFLNEPSAISFSGGRTSGYMLYKILEAHDGDLPDYVKVTFANTGKEMPETLDFIQACSDNWGVDIVWLEYGGKKKVRVVDYLMASRNGEPFAKLIQDKKYLPNMVARFCTAELKVFSIQRYMDCEYETIVGIRADEPRRAAKQKAKDGYSVPLYDNGVTISTVKDFWDTQPFNLYLPTTPTGKCNLSNCDLCFLKGAGIKISIIEHNPKLADWWIEQENLIGASFRSDQPKYSEFKQMSQNQKDLFGFDDESIPCFCGE